MNVDSQSLVVNTRRLRQRFEAAPRLAAATDSKASSRRRALGGDSDDESRIEHGSIAISAQATAAAGNDDDDEANAEDDDVDEVAPRRLKRSADEALTIDDDDDTATASKRARQSPVGGRAHRRRRRHGERKTREPAPALRARALDDVYISAQLSSGQVERLYRNDEMFTLGDGKDYGGFVNMPLDNGKSFRVMSRAFARDESGLRSDRPVSGDAKRARERYFLRVG